MVVYYGQQQAAASVPLSKLCSDPSVDVVILAFLNKYFGPGGYPGLNLGATCAGGPSAAQQAKGATGLLSCPDVAKDITTCQKSGKKVFLSLAGAVAESSIPSDDKAKELATKLWDLFGEGKGETPEVRPFGAVNIDGFDIDNENKDPAHYTQFVSELRSLNKGASTTKYISAAPQCPRPDASIPLDALKQLDFVFVQFYNNGQCNVGESGFLDSFKAWSQDLSSGPKLYIGAPACKACAGSGYLEAPELAKVVKSVTAANIKNLGGVMLWDGAEAEQNGDFLKTVKAAL